MIQLLFALKDIRKNAWVVLAFILQLIITIIFVFALVNQLMIDHYRSYGFEKLFNGKAASFEMYRSNTKHMTVTDELESLLSKTLDGNTNAYSIVRNIIPSNKSKTNIVVGLGGFGRLFGVKPYDDKGQASEISVLIGSKVKGYTVGSTIKVGTFAIKPLKVNGYLKRGASYIDNTGIHYLDNSIVVLATWDEFKTYNTLDYLNEIIENIKFINTDEKKASEFAQTVSKTTGKYDLIPVSSESINEKIKDYKQQHSLFLIFFIAIVIMIGIGIVTNLAQLVDSNMHEYVIHRLYGATLKDLYLRTVIYSIIIISIPFAIAYSIVIKLNISLRFLPLDMTLIALLMIADISAYPVFRLKNQDMIGYLRRDI